MKKNLLFIIVLLSSVYTFAQNRFQDKTLREIYDFQDERSSNDLVNFLHNPNPIYREAAALAFASVQDTIAVSHLLPLLKDKDIRVRKAAAYALGQTANVKAETDIIQSIDNEQNTGVKFFLLEALGKCASVKGLEYLVKVNFDKDSLSFGQVRGFYRAGLRNQKSEATTQKIINLLNSPSNATREMAGFYLARFANTLNIKAFEKELIQHLSNNTSASVKMNCAWTLAYVKSEAVTKALQQTAKEEKDYLIRYNALRALSRQDDLNSFFKEILSSEKNLHLSLLASQYLSNQAKKEDIAGLKELLSPKKISVLPDYFQIKVNLWTALAKVETSENVYEKFKAFFQQAKSIYEKGAWLKALAGNPKNYAWIAQQLEKIDNQALKVFALESLNQIATGGGLKKMPDSLKVKQDLAKIYRWAIESQDVGLIYTASQILLDKSLNYKRLYKDYGFIRSTLSKIQLPRDVEAYIELQKVLAYFEDKPENNDYPKSENTPIDWNTVAQIKTEQKAVIYTNKGKITLQLLVNEAPGSVETFYKLVKKGFYNDKTFHRIVSNFVVQGGCPRGDGFGGLDYTIRSEFAPLNYGEGSVGLASAGKDTESCQFFITHIPTPHLDGRYTIFAKVIEGMDVAHQMMIGDRIEKIEIQ